MADGAGFGALMGVGMGVMLVAIVVGIIFATLILMLATRIVAKFTPSFGKALVTQIVVGIVGFIVAIVFGLVLGMSTPARLAAWVVNFFVCAWIIQQLIAPPGGAVAEGGTMAVTAGGKMGYGRACLIALIEYIIYIAIAAILLLVSGGAMLAALHH